MFILILIVSIDELRLEYKSLLEESIKILKERLKDRVERIIVFGSYAKGRRDLFTDLDILIIMESNKPYIERLRELHSILTLPVDVDILCYTPDEFRIMSSKGFLKEALKDGVVVYERSKE